jgi:hypothetical protein
VLLGFNAGSVKFGCEVGLGAGLEQGAAALSIPRRSDSVCPGLLLRPRRPSSHVCATACSFSFLSLFGGSGGG